MGWFTKEPETNVVPFKPKQKRRFDAAKIGRLVSSWLGASSSIDDDLKGDLEKLRARSRELSQNNVYVAKFLRMVEDNVVGSKGFSLQGRAMEGEKPDVAANQAIEAAFSQWSMQGCCEVSGQYSFAQLCRTILRMIARDGEALIKKLPGPTNEFGYALQVLEIARLDLNRNQARSGNKNSIVMGVEIDTYRRPVAYHLKKDDGNDTERVLAKNIYHLYLPNEAEQSRGYPWAHAAMTRLHQLKGYEEAAVINARVGAAKMGFYVAPDGTAAGLGEQEEDEGEFYMSADAGEFGVVPQGYDIRTFDPTYPHQQYPEFVKACLRGIASGLGVAYNSFANDLEGVNFSSIRSGTLEERDRWITLQQWFIDSFLTPVYLEWIKAAIVAQKVTLSTGNSLPIEKLEKWQAHQWQGRRWSWVDPLKDIQAARLAIKSGLESPQSIAQKMGMDVQDVIADIKRFEEAAQGVSLIDYGVETHETD